MCPGNDLDDNDRTTLRKAHNDLRRKIVKGSAKNYAGNLNAGKNMYSLLAYDRNVALGCQYKKCTDKVVITCMYSNIVPDNAVLYERGTPCTKDTDCTLYSPAVCNNGLCKAKAVIPNPNPQGTTTAAPGAAKCANAEVTDAVRNAVIDVHNSYRSQVARGLIINGKSGQNCPTAANMYKMEYDCSLESSALVQAKTCTLTASAASSRGGQGENYYSGALVNDLEQAVRTAMQQWFNQITTSGVNPVMQFRARVRDKPNAPVAFTQMVWGTSTKVGCAVIKCPSNTYTVCRYSPAGNIVDGYVYKRGNLCGDCPAMCNNGLCGTA
ncbi:SCP-like protein [Necator americanus]|uniref:SCP-like protein n=1 Tax=Necator americanus TaxID=51031 RepID=W2TRL0_NECAM|nr:SCP-like protein [Necator americanus]ETN84443.1 SCP-like protein [Necator americanus]